MKSKDVLRILNISRATLTNLVKSGKIRVIQLPNNYYDYNSDDVYSYLGKSNDKLNVIYSRVANIKLKKSLENQVNELTYFCEENNYKIDMIFQEISPGIDLDNRPELFKLLNLVFDNQVSKVFIYSKDRFGKSCYGLFRQLLVKYGTEIVSINERSDWKLDNNEMFDEMTFLLSTFSTWQAAPKTFKKPDVRQLKPKHRILVVDDSKVTLALIEKHLSKEYLITTTNSAIEGAELLKKGEFSLVITDLNMPEVNGLDFLLWIRKHSPKVQVIMITAFSSDETRSFVNQNGAVHYFEKPLNFEKLDQFIKSIIDTKGFAGNLKDINLFDFMQMIILSGREKLIVVTDPLSKKDGLIFFKEGNIIHADYSGLSGEPAFYALMKINKGDFTDMEWFTPEKRTIHLPYDFLTINAIKLLDEKLIPFNQVPARQKNNKKILVVDDSMVALTIMENYLKTKGFSVVATNSAVKGVELLKKEFFSLVITDLFMPEVNGIEFLLWIKNNSPQSRVIIVTGLGSNEIKTFVSQNGAISYFEKPINFPELEVFIKRLFTEKEFSGTIHDMSLIEFIQLIGLSRKNKIISVIDPVENSLGIIYLRDGDIIHSEYGELTGENAFYELISISSGIFSDMPLEGNISRTINAPLHSLLLKESHADINYSGKISFSLENKPEKTNNPAVPKAVLKFVPVVTASPKNLEKVLAQKEALRELNIASSPEKTLTVYESGVALGIIPGKNKKTEVIEIMEKYSKIKTPDLKAKLFCYNDIDIGIVFDEKDVVEEMRFGKNFKGTTSSGISIGFNIEKAAQVHGRIAPPIIGGFAWENMLFLSDEKENVCSFRLNRNNYLGYPLSEVAEKQLIDKVTGKATVQPLTIDEAGEFAGIIIGKSTIDEAREIMKHYSKAFNENESSNKKLIYNDLSLNILLTLDGIVEELNFGILFKGITRKGLKIGDKIDRALELYGPPRFNNEKYGVWDKISVFCEKDNIISSINIGSI